MDGLPLHPALVHFPIAMGLVIPIVGAALLVATRRDDALVGRALWLPAGLQFLCVVLAFFAQRTGDEDHHLVEDFVDRALIHAHEEAGEVAFISAGVTLLVWFVAAVAKNPGLGRKAGWAAVAVGLVAMGLALRAGKLGGELVYLHGAAQAFTQ